MRISAETADSLLHWHQVVLGVGVDVFMRRVIIPARVDGGGGEGGEGEGEEMARATVAAGKATAAAARLMGAAGCRMRKAAAESPARDASETTRSRQQL